VGPGSKAYLVCAEDSTSSVALRTQTKPPRSFVVVVESDGLGGLK